MPEAINHPSHYRGESGIEVIDVIEDMGLGFAFDVGNAIKYIARAGAKVPAGMTVTVATIEDLRKSVWYLKRALDDKGARTLEVPLIGPAQMREAWGIDGRRLAALSHMYEIAAGVRSVQSGINAAIRAISEEIGRLENGVSL